MYTTVTRKDDRRAWRCIIDGRISLRRSGAARLSRHPAMVALRWTHISTGVYRLYTHMRAHIHTSVNGRVKRKHSGIFCPPQMRVLRGAQLSKGGCLKPAVPIVSGRRGATGNRPAAVQDAHALHCACAWRRQCCIEGCMGTGSSVCCNHRNDIVMTRRSATVALEGFSTRE